MKQLGKKRKQSPDNDRGTGNKVVPASKKLDNGQKTQYCIGRPSDDTVSGSPATGILEPKLEAKPIDAFNAEKLLFWKYDVGTVLVDRQKDRLPKRAYFVQRKGGMKTVTRAKLEPVDKEDYFELRYHTNRHADELDTVTPLRRCATSKFLSPELKKKKLDANTKNDDLEAVQYLIRDLGKVLEIAIADDSSDPFIKTGDWTNTEYYSVHMDNINATSATNSLIGDTYRKAQLVRAFSKRMTNSAGKTALTHVIDMAAIVSFGKEAVRLNFVGCHPGPDKRERFPINKVPSLLYDEVEEAYDHGSTCRCSQCTEDAFDLGESATGVSLGNNSKTSTINFVELPEGGVKADVVALSGCQPNWPHLIMVGEVKSTPHKPDCSYPFFNEAARSQLVCEMMGALLYQSLVFGILLCDKSAMLSCMKMNFDEKKIDVTSTYYGFLDGISNTKFNDTAFNALFLDIVDALNYGKENIKEVRHWPVK